MNAPGPVTGENGNKEISKNFVEFVLFAWNQGCQKMSVINEGDYLSVFSGEVEIGYVRQ